MSEPNTPDDSTRAGPPRTASTGDRSGDTGAWGMGGPARPAAPPPRLGRFEIRDLLGEGAFGRVYLAFDPELERRVAVKVPKPEGLTKDLRERFLREARATAKIHHPNVCPIYEVGSDGDVPYIVMHFVVGTTLASRLDRLDAPLPPRSAVAIARKLALGMAAAHAQGVIHRDLKPQNILYDKATHEVLITDFGLARISGVDGRTVDGAVFGTPAYMSPEQARGKQDAVGPLSDVYALGVILYQMLAGRVPFTGSVFELLVHHWETVPLAPSAVRPGLDPRLDAICLTALAKKPADRYPSAQALATALGEYLRVTAGGADDGSLAGPDADPFASGRSASSGSSAAHAPVSTSRPDATEDDRVSVRCPRCETGARVARGRAEPVECLWCNTPFSVGTGREAAARFSESGRPLPDRRPGWPPPAPLGRATHDEWLPVARGLRLSSRGVLVSVAFLFASLGVLLASAGREPGRPVYTAAWVAAALGQCAGLVVMGLGRRRAARVPFGVPGRTAAGTSALAAWLAVPCAAACYVTSRTDIVPFPICLTLLVLLAGEYWFNRYLTAIGPHIGPHFPETRARIARMYLRVSVWCALYAALVSGVILALTGRPGVNGCLAPAGCVGFVCVPVCFVMSVWLNVSAASLVERHARGDA